MVLIAFRSGLYVSGMAEQLESGEDLTTSWTYVVPGISESRAREALVDFQKSEVSVRST